MVSPSPIYQGAVSHLETRKSPRAAIIFNRLGPYHHARLNAAGNVVEVWGIEASASESVYAWAPVSGSKNFHRVTLTERDSGDYRWRRELSAKMRQALDEIRPAVVVIPGWSCAEALSALRWAREHRVPVVVMSESTVWDDVRQPWKEWMKGRFVKMCAAGLAGGTAHVDYLAQLGVPKEQIFTGYDIVDNEYFAAEADRARLEELLLRKKFNLPTKYFLASARFIEKKNLLGLLEAFGRYRKLAEKGGSRQRRGEAETEAWDLVLVGDGPLRSSILELRAALGLDDSVHLPGFKQYDELPAYYALAGAFVHASTTEQWGLVVNEAMACRLPVLVSKRCGCAPDLVRDGVNGFAFDPNDLNQVATLMHKVSAIGFPLAEFGQESHRIISLWGPDRFADGLSRAVQAALAASTPAMTWIDKCLLELACRK